MTAIHPAMPLRARAALQHLDPEDPGHDPRGCRKKREHKTAMRFLDRLDLDENGKLDDRELGRPRRPGRDSRRVQHAAMAHLDVEQAVERLDPVARERLMDQVRDLSRQLEVLRFWTNMGGAIVSMATIASLAIIPVNAGGAVAMARIIGFMIGPIGTLLASILVDDRRERLQRKLAKLALD